MYVVIFNVFILFFWNFTVARLALWEMETTKGVQILDEYVYVHFALMNLERHKWICSYD